ncbi:PREDICTED: prokineticin receptor 2-like [Branchiostoma belcheri]|uniref:Prokineticin receptor 2-like n=1 Tax=Branchiostoma belcheri TaxID=7741 RepID=A0A6P4ZVZ4_BRABE|nr:PREDICTED: prokineticin receptor 2-like [Branchiostoma belcheri]
MSTVVQDGSGDSAELWLPRVTMSGPVQGGPVDVTEAILHMFNGSNVSDVDWYQDIDANMGITSQAPDIAVVALGMVYSVFILVCGLGNLVLAAAIFRYMRLRTTVDTLIGNLALCNSVVAILCTPFELGYYVANVGSWHYGAALCSVVNFIKILALNLTSFVLLAIAFERFLVIAKSKKLQRNRNHSLLPLAFVWTAALSLASPGGHFATTLSLPDSPGTVCGVRWFSDNGESAMAYHISMALLGFVLPVLAQVALHSFVAFKILHREFPGHKNTSHRTMRLKSRRKMTRMLLMFCVYFLCIGPFYVVPMVREVSSEAKKVIDSYASVVYVLEGLASIHGVLNTVVYIAFHDAIVMTLRRMFRDLRMTLTGQKGNGEALELYGYPRRGTMSKSHGHGQSTHATPLSPVSPVSMTFPHEEVTCV